MISAKHLAGCLAAASGLALLPAQAGVIAVSGAVAQVAAPASAVANVGPESSTAASLFSEQQNLTLASAAAVDATASGTYATLASLTPGTIAVGTLVSSYYLHADPLGVLDFNNRVTFTGTVTFDTDILGVAGLNAQLLSTTFLGATGTAYPNAGNVNGLDLPDGTDSFTISNDRRTLSFTVVTWAGVDAMRVITQGAAVPEPGALSLALVALGGLALARRRRSPKA